MHDRSDVSIVIPVYNREDLIEATLDSVFQQTCLPDDVIVVDDQSTDGTVEKVTRYEGVRVLRNPTKGACAARNAGLDQVRTRYLLYLDSDDLLHPSHLEGLVTAARTRPGFCGYVSNVVEFRGTPPPVQNAESTPIGGPVDAWNVFPAPITTSPGAVLIDTQQLRESGGWLINDLFTWLQLGAISSFLQVPTNTFFYRLHEGQLVNGTSRRGQPAAYLQYLADGFDAVLHVAPPPHRPFAESVIASLQALSRTVDAVDAGTDSGAPPRVAADLCASLERLDERRMGEFVELVTWVMTPKLRSDPAFARSFLQVLAQMPALPNRADWSLLYRGMHRIGMAEAWRTGLPLPVYPRYVNGRLTEWRMGWSVRMKLYTQRRFPTLYQGLKAFRG